jgi:hypothetical protein
MQSEVQKLIQLECGIENKIVVNSGDSAIDRIEKVLLFCFLVYPSR